MLNPAISYHQTVQALKNVKPEEIRPVDYVEFLDYWRLTSLEPFIGENFSALLIAAMGLSDMRTKLIFFPGDSFTGPIFAGTCATQDTEVTEETLWTLCGFGWDKADNTLGKKDKWRVILTGLKVLVLEDVRCNFWQCFVSNDNKNTINQWKAIGKVCKEQLKVDFYPWGDTYTRVSIVRKAFIVRS